HNSHTPDFGGGVQVDVDVDMAGDKMVPDSREGSVGSNPSHEALLALLQGARERATDAMIAAHQALKEKSADLTVLVAFSTAAQQALEDARREAVRAGALPPDQQPGPPATSKKDVSKLSLSPQERKALTLYEKGQECDDFLESLRPTLPTGEWMDEQDMPVKLVRSVWGHVVSKCGADAASLRREFQRAKSWSAAEKAFREWAHKDTPFEPTEALLACVWKADESFARYNLNFRDAANRCGQIDETAQRPLPEAVRRRRIHLAHLYLRCVPPEWSFAELMANPMEPPSLEELTTLGEALSKSDSRVGRSCHFRRMPKVNIAYEACLEAPKPATTSAPATRTVPTPPPQVIGVKRPHPEGDGRPGQFKSRITCHRCGNRGHYANECAKASVEPSFKRTAPSNDPQFGKTNH
ncbi:hypothetical protein BGW38_008657, partial [Lunasporangiospora selenospora]